MLSVVSWRTSLVSEQLRRDLFQHFFFSIHLGLAGKDDWEAAQADMYVYGIEDVVQKMVPFLMALILGKGDKVKF